MRISLKFPIGQPICSVWTGQGKPIRAAAGRGSGVLGSVALATAADRCGDRAGHGPRHRVPAPDRRQPGRTDRVRDQPGVHDHQPRPRCSARQSGSLPSKPVSTVVTPSGGVAGFTATSSDLYVNNGTQLITYTLAGAKVGSFTLPSAFGPCSIVSPAGRRPVRQHLPVLLLRQAGRQVLAERHPAVVGGPEQRQPDRPVLGRHRQRLPAGGQPDPELVVEHWSSARRRGATDRDLPAGRPHRRLRHPGVRRQPAVHRERLRGDRQPHRAPSCPRSARPTSRATTCTPARGRSSSTRPRPSRAPTAPSTPPTRSTRWRPPRPPGS